ncbi:unnamed protein product [Notodromas monacha]|uniref:P/Homo B domain-containing protein n=1 Tax=Notodromas monacha TaxID=399045 RepID=A0A7R9G9C2_9CRUS|nr:unnamed protein product [Notodromas monacha]CAG0912487.1 unnamed protein product [Notodromas monacha]
MNFNDPQWSHMWYLNRGNGRDMNVKKAWAENLTGQGIVVTILDDGLEKDHPDIKRNYDPKASFDVNGFDDDPEPRYDMADSNRHGTRCAGEVAATGNNSICAVGVAFNARVGGVRMLDGLVTDAVEAKSLRLNQDHIDIYSVSWGPDDDGKTVDGPGPLATKAFIDGVTQGRKGKGSIFVWASGNGGREHDNCNCDGYTNSIWTLSISSASEHGDVVTTDLHHGCTQTHTGTSASAPLAAGICALSLEANNDLTWRDLQHIVVRTARPENLNAPDWQVNGVGRNVSHSFGYGMMDAYAMVKLSRTWRRVPPQQTCHIPATHFNKKIPAKSQVNLALEIKPSDCPNINYLEHVQAKITLRATRRGDMEIYLTSSAGTRSTLLALRPQDTSHAGFTEWPFMTVHSWGENPFGFWQLEIHNEGRYLGELTTPNFAVVVLKRLKDGESGRVVFSVATSCIVILIDVPKRRADLVDWSLILYGTKERPEDYVADAEVAESESDSDDLMRDYDALRKPHRGRNPSPGPTNNIHTLDTKDFYAPHHDVRLQPARSEGNRSFWTFAAAVMRWQPPRQQHGPF